MGHEPARSRRRVFGQPQGHRAGRSLLGVLGLAVMLATPAHGIGVRAIALTGDPVPGGAPGEIFIAFLHGSFADDRRPPVPVVNRAGQVALWGRTSLQRRRARGIWLYDADGSGREVFRGANLGQAAGSPALAEDGAVGLQRRGELLLFEPGLPPARFAATTRPGPSAGFPRAPQLNAGWISGGVDVLARDGTPRGLPVAGDAALGFPSGATVEDFPRSALVNAHGEVVFGSRVRLPGQRFAMEQGLWRIAPDDTLALLARTGGAAPDLTGAVLERIGLEPAIDGAGRIAFTGELLPGTGGVHFGRDDTALWLSDPDGGVRRVARRGDPVVGARDGERLDGIGGPLLTDGRLAFLGRLRPDDAGAGGTGAVRALFRVDDEGSIVLAAREGDRLPGLPGEVLAGFRDVILAASGDLVFTAFLERAGDRRRAILHQTPDGVTRVVLAEGDALEVRPGDTREVRRFVYSPAGSAQDGRRALDDALDLVLAVRFDDGQGILRLALPEPSAEVLGLVVLFGAGLLRRGLRRSERC